MTQDYKKYISYFQKVTTLGVITCGQNKEEAIKLAEKAVRSGNPVERCVYEETPLTHSDTEEWSPDFEILSVNPSLSGEHLDYTIKASDQYLSLVAEDCGKNKEDVTDEDFENFFLGCANEFISKAQEKYGETEIG